MKNIFLSPFKSGRRSAVAVEKRYKARISALSKHYDDMITILRNEASDFFNKCLELQDKNEQQEALLKEFRSAARRQGFEPRTFKRKDGSKGVSFSHRGFRY